MQDPVCQCRVCRLHPEYVGCFLCVGKRMTSSQAVRCSKTKFSAGCCSDSTSDALASVLSRGIGRFQAFLGAPR